MCCTNVYSWVCGFSLEYCWLTLRENCHPLSQHSSVANSCSVGGELCASLLGSGAYCLNLWDFLCTSSLLCPTECFPVVIHNLCLFHSFFLIFYNDPWTLGEGLLYMCSPLRMSILQSLSLRTLASCGSLCYSPFTGDRYFWDEG